MVFVVLRFRSQCTRRSPWCLKMSHTERRSLSDPPRLISLMPGRATGLNETLSVLMELNAVLSYLCVCVEWGHKVCAIPDDARADAET